MFVIVWQRLYTRTLTSDDIIQKKNLTETRSNITLHYNINTDMDFNYTEEINKLPEPLVL